MNQGLFFYPGIPVSEVRSAEYTQVHGTMPGVITVECRPIPLANIQRHGTAVFSYGATRIELRECSVDFASLHLTKEGHVERLRIFDKRWKWQAGGTVSGLYNERVADGTLDTSLEKNPQQLASLLLDAMNQGRYNVGALPVGPRPRMEWVCDNPARELSQLCDFYGSRVTIGIDNDPVTIVRLGNGQALPSDSDVMSVNFGADPPELPDSLWVCGGMSVFHAKLKLQAVGLDNNNRIKPLADLSYAPSGGWSEVVAGDFQQITDKTDQQLAKMTVFKWYRVVGHADGSLNIPGYGLINGVWQILPLRSVTLEKYQDPEGAYRNKRAWVEGTYWRLSDYPPSKENTDDHTIVDVDFDLFRRQGIVSFFHHVFKVNSDDQIQEADLYLTTSFHIKDATNKQELRFVYNHQIRDTPLGTGPKPLKHDEMFRTVRATYNRASTNVNRILTNDAYIQNEAIYNAQAHLADYQVERAVQVHYRGLKKIRLDGARQSVTWKVHHRHGCTTVASINSETDPYFPAYRELRAIEYQRQEFEDVPKRERVSTRITRVHGQGEF